jgi:hypothetical protein
VAELENKFSWSASRHASFAYCERQYWWAYYGSWGGWNRDAPTEARTAYVLKNLANRWTWAGTAVHETIEHVLRRIQGAAGDGQLAFGRVEVDPDAEIEAATQRMRDQWTESRNGEYRRQPKRRFGLAEHEYDEAVPREKWQATNQKVRDGLRAFFASDLFRRIQDADPKDWLPFETLDQFDFEGTPVWAVLDFAWRTEDGRVEIYDWKTGEVRPEANKLQVGCYTLYIEASRQVPPDAVTTHLVYLGRELRDFAYEMRAEDLDEIRATMRASIATMRGRLSDPEANAAVRADFPMVDDRGKCRVCAYRRLCDRE